MTPKQVFESLARLPARVWLQAALAIVGFAVLAVLGFAVIAAVAVLGLVLVLGFKARAWLGALFAGKPPPPEPPVRIDRRATDVNYEVVEKKDDERR